MRKYIIIFIVLLLAITSCTDRNSEKRTETNETEQQIDYESLENKELLNEPGLQITYYQPTGRIYEDAPRIVITFSKDITPLSDNKKFNNCKFLSIQPPIKGEFNWKGTRTLEFEPQQKLDLNREYSVTIHNGLFTVSKSDTLKEDFTFSFINKGFLVEGMFRDTLGNYIDEHYVSVKNPIYVQFNYPVSSAGLDTCIEFLSKSNEKIKFTSDVLAGKPEYIMVKPQENLQFTSDYKIRVKKCIASDYGNSGIESDYEIRFKTEKRFSVISLTPVFIRPNNNISISFSNPIDRMSKEYISIVSPDDTITNDEFNMWGNYYSGTNYYISAPFKPRTTYKITIKEEFRDLNGNTLDSPYSEEIQVGDYVPRLSISGKGFLLENYLKGYIPVKSVNHARAYVTISRMAYNGSYTDVYSGNVRINTEENVYQTVPLKFKELVNNKNGYYRMTVADISDVMFVNLTEMAVMAKMDFNGTHVLVYSLKTGKPANGAEVFFNQDFKYKTNGDGYAFIPDRNTLKQITYGKGVPLFVKKGNDESALVMNGKWDNDYPMNNYFSRYFAGYWSEHYYTNKIFTYSDRGLYKPGEIVWLKVLYRKYENDKVIIAGTPLKMKIKNSRNEVIKELNLDFGFMGTAVVACTLTQNAPTGNYYAWVGNNDFSSSTNFRVEEFKPLEFSISLTPSHEHIMQDDMPAVNVTGKYMHGAVMNGDSLYWYITSKAYTFKPKGYRKYNFEYSGNYYSNSERISEGKGVFESGAYLISAKPDLSKFTSTVMLTYMVRSKSASGQEISKSVNMIYHPSDIYIGLRSNAYVYNKNAKPVIELVCANKDGEKRNSGNIDLKVIHQKYISVKKSGTGGRTYWENELVEDTVYRKTVNIKNGSETIVIDKELDSGYYKALLTYKTGNVQHMANAWFYKIGGGSCWWGMRNDNIIELVPDKAEGEYNIGDKAEILIKSPIKDCKAMISIERGTVYETYMIDIKSNAQIITVPIKTEYLPNIIVSAYVFKGRDSEEIQEDSIDIGIPKFGIGYCNLKVNSDAKKLDVSINTDNENYEPQDSVEVTVNLKGADGKPVKGEFSIAVVDLGVLNLIGYETPDPMSFFYSNMPHFVSTFTNAGEIVGQRNYGEKGENRGGGGADERFRAEFLSLAYYNGNVMTDDKGNAVVKFRLPDNLTTFRIMAVACTEDRFGSSDKDFIVSKKFMLTPSLPNFIRPGDKISCGVVAVNMTGDGARVNVTCETDGAVITGRPTDESVLTNNSNREILYEMSVPEYKDTVTVKFRGTAGIYKDNLQIKIPCIMPAIYYASAFAENTMDSIAEHYVQKPDMIEGTGIILVSVASTGLNDIREATKYLFAYPYGCLEQQTSRILPLIIGKNLIEVFNLSSIQGKTMNSIMDNYLKNLYKYQQYDGGFYIWPEKTGYSSPYLTCYVMMVCAYAEDAGYKVDKSVKDKALAYLADIASGRETGPFYTYYSKNASLTTRMFAMMILRMNKRNINSHINNIVNSVEKMNIETLAYLSYIISGQDKYKDVQKRVIERINQKTIIESRTATIEDEYDYWIYGSNTKNTSLGLWALLNIFKEDTEHADKFIYWILRARKNNRWASTQENAYVLMAIDMYFRTFEGIEPDFKAKVTADAREILNTAFKGYSSDVVSSEINLDQFKNERIKLKMEKSGKGRMYYQVMLKFAPKSIQYRDNGFAVTKKIQPVKENVKGYIRGELYKVTLKVSTKSDRLYVVVDDPLPAGFEIVNTAFKTNAGLTKGTGSKGYSWFGGFNHTETYFDRMLLFSDYLYKGDHEYTYIVRATYPGVFNMPATKAEEMYTPEVFGNSSSAVIEIK